jgi:hypothetical protein
MTEQLVTKEQKETEEIKEEKQEEEIKGKPKVAKKIREELIRAELIAEAIPRIKNTIPLKIQLSIKAEEEYQSILELRKVRKEVTKISSELQPKSKLTPSILGKTQILVKEGTPSINEAYEEKKVEFVKTSDTSPQIRETTISSLREIELGEIRKESKELRIEKVELREPPSWLSEHKKAVREIVESMVETSKLVTEENILNELFQVVKGGDLLRWKTHKALCLVLTGDEPKNGMKMIEDIISTKYTFHGFHEFLRNLPWQRDMESGSVKKGEEILKEMEKEIYDKIISKDLIVSAIVSAKEKKNIIKGLREVAYKGAKCLILYVKDVKDFEDLDLEVADVDIKIVGLPKLDDKTRRSIGTLIGVDLKDVIANSIDQLWHKALKLYEEEVDELNKKLPHVPFFPEREGLMHFLMKRIVYTYLKNKEEYKSKSIKVEEPLLTPDEKGEVKQVIPDIVIDDECWEVETGYPSKDEPIMDQSNPFARLVLKLKKYREMGYLKIRVVAPTIYAHMFKDDIKEAKRHFKEVYDLEIKFYTINWSKGVCQPFL